MRFEGKIVATRQEARWGVVTVTNISKRRAFLEFLGNSGCVMVICGAINNERIVEASGESAKLDITVSNECWVFEANDCVQCWLEDVDLV